MPAALNLLATRPANLTVASLSTISEEFSVKTRYSQLFFPGPGNCNTEHNIYSCTNKFLNMWFQYCYTHIYKSCMPICPAIVFSRNIPYSIARVSLAIKPDSIPQSGKIVWGHAILPFLTHEFNQLCNCHMMLVIVTMLAYSSKCNLCNSRCCQPCLWLKTSNRDRSLECCACSDVSLNACVMFWLIAYFFIM